MKEARRETANTYALESQFSWIWSGNIYLELTRPYGATARIKARGDRAAPGPARRETAEPRTHHRGTRRTPDHVRRVHRSGHRRVLGVSKHQKSVSRRSRHPRHTIQSTPGRRRTRAHCGAHPVAALQCFPFPAVPIRNQILQPSEHQIYGVNPEISGIYPIPAAESKVGYIPLFWHAAVARPCVFVRAESMPKAATDWASRSSTSRRVSAAHLGWVRAAALPRGRTVPARRPLCRRRPIGARKKRKATGSAGEPPAAAARSPTAASQGHSDRQQAATAAQDGSPGQLLRALRAGANWSPPNSHPSTHGRDAPGDANP